MIGNTAALLGILAIAVPILIHLLGRNRSKVERFPSLRFIEPSRLVPTRRRRISDLPLLLVRCAIVALAAVALSQPYFACSGRTAPTSTASTISRAIIVDGSPSMTRVRDSAKSLAASLQSGAIATVIEANDVRAAVPGAAAWLATRQGTRELVILSDFQVGTVDSADLARLPAGTGVQAVRLPRTSSLQLDDSSSRVALLYGRNDTTRLCHPERSEGPAPGDVQIPRCARDDKWMGRVLVELQRDPVIRSIQTAPIGAARDSTRLLIYVPGDSLSLIAFALREAVLHATDVGLHGAEGDLTYMTDAEVAALRRPAQPVAAPSPDATDARWVWIAVLLLIALESWMRSRQPGRARDEIAADENARRAA